MMKLFALCIIVLSLVPLSSGFVELGGQSGKDALNSIQTGSSLWNWGSAPLGHALNGNELISGVQRDPLDMSAMETPLQAQGIDSGGWIATVYSGFDSLSTAEKSLEAGPGVIDTSMFKPPTKAEFPRVY
jgi:hypothetical protein